MSYAFNFPAIILVSQDKSWSKLNGLYKELAHGKDKQIKTSLAASYHEVFRLLSQYMSSEIGN